MQLTKQRVLVVDDEPQILLALEDLLADDYTVLKSETPERALELVQNDHELAVVITDQRMPHMNGDEFLSKLGDSSHALRIMVSGYADLPAVLRAINTGKVFSYITKPWDEQDLLHKVHAAAEHFRLGYELENERRLLLNLMDNSPDGIYFKDAELRFLRANTAFARSLGRRLPEELVGRRLSDLVDAEHEAAAIEAEDRQVLREQRPILDSVRASRLTGRSTFLSESRAPLSGSDGAAAGLLGISRDVTERVATTEALRESEGLLQQQTNILGSILDGMGEGVVVAARDGRTLLCNVEATRLLGSHAGTVSAEAWPETFGLHSEDGETPLPQAQNPVRRALNGESPIQLHVCIKRSASASALVALTATPLRDASGAVTGAIILLRDITQQHKLEQRVAQSKRMEAIGSLAGGIAHDFNNLLTIIIGCGELTLEDLKGDELNRENVAQILGAARHATLLTQQLLAFSRQQVIHPRNLQLNDVALGIETILRRLAGDQIRTQLILPNGLGMICADQSQIEQILLNLVVNARDAMPDGGQLQVETSEVTLTEASASKLDVEAGRFIALTVSDTGTGMTDETRKRLFEPFFTTKEFGKGTGLGLSTVYGIVQQNGGDISVHSSLGKGTAFKVLLPRAPSIPATVPPAMAPTGAATVLLVENDSAIRQLAATILRAEGHIVLEASRPADARRVLSEHAGDIDVLMTDIGKAGAELGAEVAAKWPQVRPIFITGGVRLTRQEASLPLGQHALLEKPFSRSGLVEAVRQVLPSRSRPLAET